MIFGRSAELLYQGLNRLRRDLYRRGVLKTRRLPRPVVSVGNLAVGGSGKTPTVIAIGSELERRGKRVAILTRGYGREGSAAVAIVDRPDPATFGDEPVLLARRLPGITVVVGRDRFETGLFFLRDRDCDVFILDDGFQHLQLHRDADVVLVSPNSRWQREGLSALRDADLILTRNAEGRAAPSSAYCATLRPTHFIVGSEEHPIEQLRGRDVLAFSGLADNEQFFELMRSRARSVVRTESFPDHATYSNEQLARLKRIASEHGAIAVTTEKDFVKISDPGIAWIHVEMIIEPEKEFYDSLLRLVE